MTEPARGGASPADRTAIDAGGRSLRVIDLSRPGRPFDGTLVTTPKKFDVQAKDIGQVFGVALDDQTPPNIYVAATSAYGLSLVSRGRDGTAERRKKGGPGVGWMRGQFGLELQGGPGAIYKIDGRSGVVTLLTNVTLDGVPNPGTGLGNLAYDAAHRQLFVSDLYTGMIHRIDLDGRDLGQFDHGAAGRAAANQPPLPFNPRNRPNISSDRFDTEQPETWGFAPAPRRVFGLAVSEGRLYYSVTAGPQIWSVGIMPDGNFAADPNLEVELQSPMTVTDIAFAHNGAMILAQRAATSGAYDYAALTRAGEPRVLRYTLKAPNDPPSPGRWRPAADEYAVGFAGTFRNTNGGVALSYGYRSDNTLDTGACEASLWTTGQTLLNGPNAVNGLQGNPADRVRPANEPPSVASFVDFDDKLTDPGSTGHLGSVRIIARPCVAPVAAVAPPPPPPPPTVIGGGGGRACTPSCVCPSGTIFKDGTCQTTDIKCPDGQILIDGKCVKRPPLAIIGGRCVPPSIPGPTPDSCVCPQGMVQQGRTCVTPRNACTPPMVPGPCDENIDLAIKKIGETSPPPDVPWYNWTLNVTNVADPFNGNNIIVVTDNAPPGMTFLGVTATPASDWDCSNFTATSVQCIYKGSGPVSPGELLGTITIQARANGNGPYPPFTNCATVGIVPGSGYHDSNAGNDQSCDTVTKPAILVVQKKVQNNGPILLPTIPFPFTVDCSNSSFSLTDGGSQTINGVTVGASCTVSETLPTPPNVCPQGTVPTWNTTWSPSQTITIQSGTNTVTATNTFDCKKRETATLIVSKVVVNNAPRPLPSVSFPFTVDCSNSTFSLTGGNSQTIGNVAVGATCTVTENPSTPPNICPDGTTPTWTTTPSPSQTITIQAGTNTVTMTNTLDCKKGGGDTGTLVVKKIVTSTVFGAQIAGWAYPIAVTCAGTTANISLPDGGSQTYGSLLTGTQCHVQEATLTQPPGGGCAIAGDVPTWTTTYSPSQDVTISGGSTSTITVNNSLDCKPGTGTGDTTLIVTKKVQNNTRANLGGITYPIIYNCSYGNGLGLPGNAPLQDGGSQTVTGVISGSTCTATDIPPAAPSGVCPKDQTAVWTVTSSPTSVTTGSSPVSITVINTLDCKDIKKVECRAPAVPNSNGTDCVCPDRQSYVPGVGCRPVTPPPACSPPMMAGPLPGSCVCPAGTTLKGKECVKVDSSACPDGQIRRGKRCVEPVTCRPPARRNAAGTACTCPEGMTKKGNTCVEREHPRINPRDVIHDVPGIGFPGGGGRGSPGGGGGHGSPGGGGGKTR